MIVGHFYEIWPEIFLFVTILTLFTLYDTIYCVYELILIPIALKGYRLVGGTLFFSNLFYLIQLY